MSKGLAVVGAVAIGLVLVAIPILMFILVPQDALRTMSYLAITFTSVFACGLLIVLIALIAVILVLVLTINNLAANKISPLIDKVTETADSAKGTVAYVGEGVVSPLIKIAAILAGIRAAIQALFRGGKR